MDDVLTEGLMAVSTEVFQDKSHAQMSGVFSTAVMRKAMALTLPVVWLCSQRLKKLHCFKYLNYYTVCYKVII